MPAVRGREGGALAKLLWGAFVLKGGAWGSCSVSDRRLWGCPAPLDRCSSSSALQVAPTWEPSPPRPPASPGWAFRAWAEPSAWEESRAGSSSPSLGCPPRAEPGAGLAAASPPTDPLFPPTASSGPSASPPSCPPPARLRPLGVSSGPGFGRGAAGTPPGPQGGDAPSFLPLSRSSDLHQPLCQPGGLPAHAPLHQPLPDQRPGPR